MSGILRKTILTAAALSAAVSIYAFDNGYVSGSLESNSIRYMNDPLTGNSPSDRFGSNNFLKVDYYSGKFSAGIQGEAYLPALQGFEIGIQPGQRQLFLASKYIRWQDEHFSVHVGDIYSQFGNGLVFRSYEDRQLGFNNSIEGVCASVDLGGFLALKGLAGRPRLYSQYAASMIRGGNLCFSISDLLHLDGLNLNLEGSCVNRYEALDKDPVLGNNFLMSGLTDPNVNLYSGNLNLDWKFLSLKGEYAVKSNDLYAASAPLASTGSAAYAELGMNGLGLSFSGSFRRLEKMGTMLSLYGEGTGNTLNYLPALTRQYTYMLANLNPYQVNTEGEIGGQADLYYTLKSRNNRHRKWTFHTNFSLWKTALEDQSESGNSEKLWQDFNADVECQWGKKLKTIFLVSIQEWNPTHGCRHLTYVSNIAVADLLYKIDRKHSVRLEAQYLYSSEKEEVGSWLAGLAEFNFAPKWSVFVSDMFRYDSTDKENYYSFGGSYTKGRTRLMLTYGRNRAGYVCSGGVCRYSPAYTGLNFSLTTSF